MNTYIKIIGFPSYYFFYYCSCQLRNKYIHQLYSSKNGFTHSLTQMGTNIKLCQTKWKSLRDRYIKIINKEKITLENGSPIKRNNWKYFRFLHFLKDTLKPSRTEHNMNLESSIEVEEIIDDNSYNDCNIELHDYNENSSEDILEHIKEEEIEWIDNDDIIEVNEEIKEEKDIFRNFELRKSDKFFLKGLASDFEDIQNFEQIDKLQLEIKKIVFQFKYKKQ
ncbi:uncharacterized protein [Lepeophtheirus salmonis]|uniref:uncharacterized protein isoform X2 n=1 Tax=Lepeophtheirus salmonis TaxID=72036 RepID=UPI001AE20379|nr:uncharacterized protein LOC121127923 isoform X2 [Lepeophtheirus salmonis]